MSAKDDEKFTLLSQSKELMKNGLRVLSAMNRAYRQTIGNRAAGLILDLDEKIYRLIYQKDRRKEGIEEAIVTAEVLIRLIDVIVDLDTLAAKNMKRPLEALNKIISMLLGFRKSNSVNA